MVPGLWEESVQAEGLGWESRATWASQSQLAEEAEGKGWALTLALEPGACSGIHCLELDTPWAEGPLGTKASRMPCRTFELHWQAFAVCAEWQ
jgi:hypothetical protein